MPPKGQANDVKHEPSHEEHADEKSSSMLASEGADDDDTKMGQDERC